LGQLVTGESNKGIAFNLGLSVSTVKFHLKNLMAKTGAQSRSEVLLEAIRRGWVSL
jgi:DNA-binding NarL/FixJ family response regulator